jgi:hypothetical protein
MPDSLPAKTCRRNPHKALIGKPIGEAAAQSANEGGLRALGALTIVQIFAAFVAVCSRPSLFA